MFDVTRGALLIGAVVVVAAGVRVSKVVLC